MQHHGVREELGISTYAYSYGSFFSSGFYSARNARIASAVLDTAIPSVRPSVCLSVPRRIPTLLHGLGSNLGNSRDALKGAL